MSSMLLTIGGCLAGLGLTWRCMELERDVTGEGEVGREPLVEDGGSGTSVKGSPVMALR